MNVKAGPVQSREGKISIGSWYCAGSALNTPTSGLEWTLPMTFIVGAHDASPLAQ